jgi:hypothetical protein
MVRVDSTTHPYLYVRVTFRSKLFDRPLRIDRSGEYLHRLTHSFNDHTTIEGMREELRVDKGDFDGLEDWRVTVPVLCGIITKAMAPRKDLPCCASYDKKLGGVC